MKIQKHVFSWESDESQKIFLKYHRGDAETARFEVEKLIDHLSLKPPGEVLDVGCGLGFHLCAFEQYNFSGIGIDVSDHIINEASQNCKNLALCKLVKMRGSEIKWKNRFDLVYSLALPLGFMDEDELQTHIQKMWDAVKEGGTLLMGIPHMLDLSDDFSPINKWNKAEGVYTLTDKSIDGNNIKREHCVVIDPAANTIDEWFEEQRYYSGDDMIDLLKQCGVEASKARFDLHGDRSTDLHLNPKLFIARKCH